MGGSAASRLRLRAALRGLAVIICLVVMATAAAARDSLAGPVPAEVLDILDGDTILVRARIWLGQDVETRVRLIGVDTPELRGKCAEERRLAEAARTFLVERLARRQVFLRDVQVDKFGGRVLARVVTPDGAGVGESLIAAGLARPYQGGARQSWCKSRAGG